MIDRTLTVAEIVTRHSATARVFQSHGIDFCCRGGVPVEEACAGRGLDPAALYAALEAAVAGAPDAGEDVAALATPALLARIVDRHHGYLRRALPFLRPLAEKVARVHGAHEPDLVRVDELVRELEAALLPHLQEEEEVLFPALLTRNPEAPALLALMIEEHLEVGAKLGELRARSHEFTTPDWGCTSYRALMQELEALEGDILRHVHLENHVLAPRFAARKAA